MRREGEIGIKRRGRGKASATLALVAAAVDILAEIQPCTVRAVCYRLFVMELIPDMSKSSTDMVSRNLVWAREQGMVPWPWIVDEGRQPEHVAAWSDPEAIIAGAIRQYRKDYWQDQPHRVEVWSEKGTVRGTIQPVLQQYGVTLRVMGGYGSATTVFDAAEASQADDKPFTAIYIGDHDPSGRHMSEVDLPTRITRYGGEVQVVRVALSDRDVQAGTNIPSFNVDSKRSDPRHRWFRERYGTRCFELDAMSPPVLRDRVEDAIRARLDLAAWNHSLMVENAERESMSTILGSWKASISGQAGKYSGGPADG